MNMRMDVEQYRRVYYCRLEPFDFVKLTLRGQGETVVQVDRRQDILFCSVIAHHRVPAQCQEGLAVCRGNRRRPTPGLGVYRVDR